MATALTYPGVYIQEIPSGVRTITGVATSITAFVGRALRGPVDEPVTINSFGDFGRLFGGLWVDSALGFAVRDFFLNGGSQAIVVRLYRPDGDESAAKLDANGLKLQAISPGAWGNELRARVETFDVETFDPGVPAETEVAAVIAESLGVEPDELFTLRVRDMGTGAEEAFRNVTTVESPRRVDRILESQSQLVRVSVRQQPGAHEPATNSNVWDDSEQSSGVQENDRASDGEELNSDCFIGGEKEEAKTGLYALEKADLFNLLCLPPYKSSKGTPDQDIDPGLISEAASYCEKRRAFLILDPPSTWESKGEARDNVGSIGTSSKNAAVYFPRLVALHPLRGGQLGTFAPCGAVAGVMARTDATRGIWKAPAGLEATINGTVGLSVELTDPENGELNPLAVNCLRAKPPGGRVIWGARTLQGDDRLVSEWKYIPVRRLTLYVEESLYRGTQWVVFEPNDEPLWSQIRLNINAFMQNLFRQGAFQGKSPGEAYFVKCDRETTTQYDIGQGVVNIEVGFAPLKPAEFVVIKIQQMAGQVEA